MGGRRLTFSDSENFRCNICGNTCNRPSGPPGREVPSCSACGSTVRLRSLIALLSREIFGIELAIPDFPVLKGIRGFGMSDPPELALRLAEKFSYTNTFYHQEPRLDIADPSPEHLRQHTGLYDFILTSEVLEHVSPPVERAFVNINRMLKPDGLLLLTVPYRIDGRTAEHFPQLHEYALASPGGRTVLVNRRRDGSLEVFENLSFHGGDGSTLEMRVFTETSLKEIITGAGFASVRVASEDVPEFGVLHGETWSLPIVGRKGDFRPPSAEIARAYGDAAKKCRSFEQQLAERTKWALALKEEKESALAEFQRVVAQDEEAARHIQHLEKSLAEARDARAKIESSFWMRAGKKLGAI
jgi:SAM-dependent methyltransferase